MGWMSWQYFRCVTDCTAFPDRCISEALYEAQADALVSGGYAAAGYTGVHLDDCIMDANGRDPVTGALRSDPVRFSSGFAALGSRLRAANLSLGLYTAESTATCGGWPASRGHEVLDAATFAAWGVQYLKADGCGDAAYYPVGYPLMGSALQDSGASIVYSCSWPAYLGTDEAAKPFAALIAAGCNLWRNFVDMGPTSGYVQGILEHFGNYSATLAEWAGPGAWHDPDQLLVGTDGISEGLGRSQMALYCILAAPLILGTDVRQMTAAGAATLLNAHAIAVNQDPLGRMGVRLGGATTSLAPTQVWYRPLANGDVAVALYNAGPPPAHVWHTDCAADDFNATTGGYFSSATTPPVSWCGPALGASLLAFYCCNTEDCGGWFWNDTSKTGCMLKDAAGPWVAGDANVTGATRNAFTPPSGPPADITVDFADVGLFASAPVSVFDIWAGTQVAVVNGSFTARAVPWQDTAFYRLSAA